MKTRTVEIEQRMGVKPGRKRLRDLKEEVTGELLPRAFSRYSTTFAWIDRAGGTGKYQNWRGTNKFTGVTQINWADGTASGYSIWNR